MRTKKTYLKIEIPMQHLYIFERRQDRATYATEGSFFAVAGLDRQQPVFMSLTPGQWLHRENVRSTVG